MSVAAFRPQGHFFWLQMVDGVLSQVLGIRARGLSCNGSGYFSEVPTRNLLYLL